jgi:hypothetical protein
MVYFAIQIHYLSDGKGYAPEKRHTITAISAAVVSFHASFSLFTNHQSI